VLYPTILSIIFQNYLQKKSVVLRIYDLYKGIYLDYVFLDFSTTNNTNMLIPYCSRFIVDSMTTKEFFMKYYDGDGAVYFDPKDVSPIRNVLYNVLDDTKLCE